MGLYLMLSNLTEKGRGRVKSHPERIQEVNAEVESRGYKVVAQYALLGDYDFATILDVPDNWNMTRLSLDLTARGTIETHTFPALRVEEFVRFMKSEHDEDEWARRHQYGDIAPHERDLGSTPVE